MAFKIGQKVIFVENVKMELPPELLSTYNYSQVEISNPDEILLPLSEHIISEIHMYRYIPDLLILNGIKGQYNSRCFDDCERYREYLKLSNIRKLNERHLFDLAKNKLEHVVSIYKQQSKFCNFDKDIFLKCAKKMGFKETKNLNVLNYTHDNGQYDYTNYKLIWYNDCLGMKTEYCNEDGGGLGNAEYNTNIGDL